MLLDSNLNVLRGRGGRAGDTCTYIYSPSFSLSLESPRVLPVTWLKRRKSKLSKAAQLSLTLHLATETLGGGLRKPNLRRSHQSPRKSPARPHAGTKLKCGHEELGLSHCPRELSTMGSKRPKLSPNRSYQVNVEDEIPLLRIHVVSARGLPRSASAVGMPDPYVIVKFNGDKVGWPPCSRYGRRVMCHTGAVHNIPGGVEQSWCWNDDIQAILDFKIFPRNETQQLDPLPRLHKTRLFVSL